MQPPSRREGPGYHVSEEEKQRFARDGYVHLRSVLDRDELAELAATVDRFLSREIPVPGKDFCDMSGEYGRRPEDFEIVNVMLPRRYYPPWQGQLFEQRCASIAEQLCGPDMVVDYDQILAKRPNTPDADFAWHQDMAYWIETADMRTATCWLAIDDSTIENGCMRFVPGSQTEPLRAHRPLHTDRGASHTLVADLDPFSDRVRYQPIAAGDITVHDERVLHGSAGNASDGFRRAYVLAFRARATVEEERRRGFTHSHNDAASVLDSVGVAAETRRDRAPFVVREQP